MAFPLAEESGNFPKRLFRLQKFHRGMLFWRRQPGLIDLMTFNPDDERLDLECKELCIALNRLPGIYTYESCCGHGKHPFWVWFRVDEISQGLLLLTRLLCASDSTFNFDVKLTFNLTFSKLAFLLESKEIGKPAFKQARKLAFAINKCVDCKGNVKWPTGGSQVKSRPRSRKRKN